jgi:hypothetical protein
MRSLLRTSLLFAAALIISVPASAQVYNRVTFTAPFSFVAAGKILPAGTYSIAPTSSAPNVLALTNDRRTVVLMEVDAAPPPDQPLAKSELVFRKLDDGRYELTQVWNAADDSGANIAWAAFNGTRGVAASENGHQPNSR